MARNPIAVAQQSIPGAASTLRVRWPRGITDGGDGQGVDKFGPPDTNNFQVTAFSGGTQQTLVKAGAAAVDFKSTAGPTGYGLNYARRLSWFTERTGGTLVDGHACMSFRLTGLFDPAPGVIAGDLGIVITCGNNNSMNADGLGTNPGIMFGVRNTGVIGLQARAVNGGALTLNYAVPAGLTPDLTKWNTFDLRVVSGSPDSDPVIFGLIDDVVVTPLYPLTAAAALCPPPNAVAGNYGYQFYVINRANGGVPNLYIHEVLLTAAQAESGLD